MFRICSGTGCTAVVIGLLALTTGVYTLEQGQSCVNPRGESGTCILFRECQSLVELFKKPDATPEEYKYVLSCQCGSVGYKKLVCCAEPSSSSETNNPPTTKPPTIIPPTSGVLPEPPICGLQVSDRIIGGEPTEPDEFPWTALIEYKKRDGTFGFHCGGSLINERHVLTAAHCVTNLPHGWTVHRVRLGEWDLTTDPDCYTDPPSSEPQCFASPIDFEPFKIIKHNSYDTRDASKANDIALIRFDRDVEYSDTIRPICLPLAQTLRRKDHTGTQGWAVGWGKTEFNSRSDVKLKVNLTINSHQECSPAYRRNGIALKPVHLCAGGQSGKDTCTGDSGGPLMRAMAGAWYLLGVVSYGPSKCGSFGVSGIYVNVAEYIDWIQENIQ